MNIFRLLRNFELLERVAATKGAVARFVVSLLRSRYFIISASFYLLLALILAPIAITHYKTVQSIFVTDRPLVDFRHPPAASIPDIPRPGISEKSEAAGKNVADASKQLVTEGMGILKPSSDRPLTVNVPTPHVQPSLPPVAAPALDALDGKIGTSVRGLIDIAERERIKNVKIFQDPWNVRDYRDRSVSDIPSYDHGAGRVVRATFTIFQAQYRGGDWNCNPTALQNMMLQIRAWSKDRLDAKLTPEVLDIGTEKLFTLHPPFVYLTGHRDFRLTDNEIKNLRDYLNVGGAIWGDNALAGLRSRFDLAFRREIKRVLPDRHFEVVPQNHEVFNTFFDNVSLPTGMNFYRAPVEMITIGGKLAVIYTLNGYGHFWEARLNKDGKIEWGTVNVAERGKPPKWQHVYGPHLASSEAHIIYRNITDETTRNAYKLGINVIVHLLTRYQRDFMLLPRELPASP